MDQYGGPHSYGTAVAVSPSDSVFLAQTARGLYIGVVGDVTVVMRDGSVVLFKAVPAGTLLPICVKRVNSTGTTATQIVALI